MHIACTHKRYWWTSHEYVRCCRYLAQHITIYVNASKTLVLSYLRGLHSMIVYIRLVFLGWFFNIAVALIGMGAIVHTFWTRRHKPVLS